MTVKKPLKHWLYKQFFEKYGIIEAMDYHDFIWDLGGTLLDNYETSTKAFVATLQYFQREADHDSVYAALKVSTDYAVQQFASDLPDFFGRV